jgi:hypothetical protein
MTGSNPTDIWKMKDQSNFSLHWPAQRKTLPFFHIISFVRILSRSCSVFTYVNYVTWFYATNIYLTYPYEIIVNSRRISLALLWILLCLVVWILQIVCFSWRHATDQTINFQHVNRRFTAICVNNSLNLALINLTFEANVEDMASFRGRLHCTIECISNKL